LFEKKKIKFLIPDINSQVSSFNLRYIWFRPNHWLSQKPLDYLKAGHGGGFCLRCQLLLLPEEDAAVVTGLTVVATPAEAFGVDRHVLGDGEDGEGQAFLQSSLESVLEVGGAAKVQPLVEVDVDGVVVKVGHGGQRHVDVIQPDVDADDGINLLVGEGLVGHGDFGLGRVPATSANSD
jgi:hypothetical protein